MQKERMSEEERAALKQAKLAWRKSLRAFYPNWTKKSAGKKDDSGFIRMNIHN